MIEHYFTFLPGIGTKGQETLYRSGIQTWDAFITAENIPNMSSFRKQYYSRLLQKARHALREKECSFFISVQETWRLYDTFKDSCVFLDLEAGQQKHIVVMGISDGEFFHSFIRGYNLDKHLMQQLLRNVKLVVTFNGSSFDLPIIKRKLGPLFSKIPHIDLKNLCASVGLTGGLKDIEQQLGLERTEIVDVISTWNTWYRTRKQDVLQKLLTYNREDTLNLEPIMEYCFQKKKMEALYCAQQSI